MKEYILSLMAAQPEANGKRNIMREYLQATILRHLHDKGVFRVAAFIGGTALRFLYDLPRYSEDLDMSLTGTEQLPFEPLMKTVKDELTLAGYHVSISYNDTQTVQYANIKFDDLLFEAGLTPHRNQRFSIKLDVDTRPPEGPVLVSRLVNKYFPLTFLTYDPPSLLSGKLHALLARSHVKGRDYFDLAWCLSRWKNMAPNIPFLRNALIQTKFNKDLPTESSWRAIVTTIVQQTDWNMVTTDVTNFLERPADKNILTKENVLNLLSEPQ